VTPSAELISPEAQSPIHTSAPRQCRLCGRNVRHGGELCRGCLISLEGHWRVAKARQQTRGSQAAETRRNNAGRVMEPCEPPGVAHSDAYQTDVVRNCRWFELRFARALDVLESYAAQVRRGGHAALRHTPLQRFQRVGLTLVPFIEPFPDTIPAGAGCPITSRYLRSANAFARIGPIQRVAFPTGGTFAVEVEVPAGLLRTFSCSPSGPSRSPEPCPRRRRDKDSSPMARYALRPLASGRD
jgi:hypothetical protein